jgi:hypothetical protein
MAGRRTRVPGARGSAVTRSRQPGYLGTSPGPWLCGPASRRVCLCQICECFVAITLALTTCQRLTRAGTGQIVLSDARPVTGSELTTVRHPQALTLMPDEERHVYSGDGHPARAAPVRNRTANSPPHAARLLACPRRVGQIAPDATELVTLCAAGRSGPLVAPRRVHALGDRGPRDLARLP